MWHALCVATDHSLHQAYTILTQLEERGGDNSVLSEVLKPYGVMYSFVISFREEV